MPIEKDKVKGIEISALVRNVKKKFGDDGLLAILNQTPEQDRGIFVKGISALKWYETEMYTHLMTAVHTVYGDPEYSVIKELGRQNAESMFNGVFRIFLTFISPASLLQHASKFWSQIHTTGSLVVVESKNGYVKGRIMNCLIPGKIYCIFSAAYFQRMFELCGAKNVRVKEPKCFCQGDEYCEYDVSWN